MMDILIVEDEADARETLREAFEDEGYSVTVASNGAEALATLGRIQAPNVVVLDLLMPVMNGNQVYEAMQRDPRLARVPVLITTSDPSRAPSGVLVMRKPLNLQRLFDAVRSLLVPVAPQSP